MKTFTPTSGIGSWYFLGNRNLIEEHPINNSTITSTMLLTSDEILIDSHWRIVYEEFYSATVPSPTYNLMQELINRKIVKEIDFPLMPNPNNYEDELRILIFYFLTQWCEFHKIEFNEKFVEKELEDPFSFMFSSAQDQIFKLSENDWEILLTSFFLFIMKGVEFDKLFDPQGYGNYFNSITKSSFNTDKSSPLVEYYYIVSSEIVPEVALYLSEKEEETVAPSAFVTHGFEAKGYSKCDNTKTLKNLDKFLKIRDSSVCKDLREKYSTLQNDIMSNPEMAINLPKTKEDFHKNWNFASLEIKKKMKSVTRLDRVTDIITIPAFMGSVSYPIVGAIPLFTWGASKLIKRRNMQNFNKKYPWYCIAEQMGEIGDKIKDKFDIK